MLLIINVIVFFSLCIHEYREARRLSCYLPALDKKILKLNNNK